MNREYDPGSADLARVEREGSEWRLVVVKEFRHSPQKVWQALTNPDDLQQWAPFDTDANLGLPGVTAHLTTIGSTETPVSECKVKTAEAPKLLEYNWGEHDLRWTLEPTELGTRLTLWTSIALPYIAMGAAGWHLCLDVMEHWLTGEPLGRIVGSAALQLEGWRLLHQHYAEKFRRVMER
jgi:uncharacterized protein YndB with AHSA1/START domain